MLRYRSRFPSLHERRLATPRSGAKRKTSFACGGLPWSHYEPTISAPRGLLTARRRARTRSAREAVDSTWRTNRQMQSFTKSQTKNRWLPSDSGTGGTLDAVGELASSLAIPLPSSGDPNGERQQARSTLSMVQQAWLPLRLRYSVRADTIHV